MPGFLGCINNENKNLFLKNKREDLICNTMYNALVYIERRTINKFLKDKVFYENNNFMIVTEGVILNSIDIIEKYRSQTFVEAIIEMYRKNGDEFFDEFRGSFSGFFYDKNKGKKIVFTNHIGDKQVFYSSINNSLVFGSEINYIIEYYKKNNLIYTLKEESAYQLLTYGYMLEDNTLFKEIKKLIPGHYILIEKDKMEIIQYYKLNNTPDYSRTEEEIISNTDKLFRQAVKRAFEKDKEYGYKHLAALSGGLDSRMTTWVANDMGYGDNIVNYTFSQSDYLDESIAKEIARDLKHDWIFKFLDNGLFLRDIDRVVETSSGKALYYSLAHGKSCVDLIDLKKFGIIHTGQVGGIIKGYYNSQEDVKFGGSYSNVLINKIDFKKLKKYANESEFVLLNRQFNGTLEGSIILQQETETYSPYLDIDLLKYSLQTPDLYDNNEIFIKWMIKKYPGSTKYIWENTGGKVTDKRINILGKQVLLKKLPSKSIDYLIRKLKNKSKTSQKNHMNPLRYWYETNSDLKEFMDSYYKHNIDLLDFNKELKEDCKYLYENEVNREKNQVLTLLSVLKIYFRDNNYER